MQVASVEKSSLYAAGNIRSTDVSGLKVLLEGREGSLNNFRLFHSQSPPDMPSGFEAPRHRHNFDQLRLPLAGSFEYAPGKKLPEGWVGYFPEGVHYGPQMRHPGLALLTLQFGGASGSGYLSSGQRRRGFDELVERGAFESGAYVWFDEKGQRHKQDAFEAVWERVMGRDLVYPAPRYNDLVFMNPGAYAWARAAANEGVSWKHLGSFTENRVEVGFIKMEPQGKLHLGAADAIEILFLTRGKIGDVDGAYGPNHAFSQDVSDPPMSIEAIEPSELFYVRIPKVSAATD